MSNLSATELRRIERQFAEGIRCAVVVEIFKGKGHRFSAATLRKYVQLGLLPKSRRVGVRGRHRGSSGLYPIDIVRTIQSIKQELDEGATLEQVRVSRVGLKGEVQVLRNACEGVLARFAEAVGQLEGQGRRMTVRRLGQHRQSFQRQLRELERLAQEMGQHRGQD